MILPECNMVLPVTHLEVCCNRTPVFFYSVHYRAKQLM